MGTTSRWAQAALAHVARRATGPAVPRASRITLNFHPDRTADGASVLARLGRDGSYRSQFETGTSNGGLTAFPGGDRWRWEHRMFGGAYDDAPVAARPRYGALDHRGRSLGGAPRFGSAHLRLREHVLDRSTFCFPDSVLDPVDVGTAEHCALSTLADVFAAEPRTDADERLSGGQLDDYVEAHIHGSVDLGSDVEALVLDPSFHGTRTADEAVALSAAWGVAIEWHEGRQLALDELDRHPEFRGADAVTLGHRVAVDGVLDARVVGLAVAAGEEDSQALKRLWHLVARFGSPV